MKISVLLFLLNVTLQGDMKIISNSFKHSQDLNKKFSCDGEKIIPNLKWSDFPKDTKSFALVMDDPDAPSGTFTHVVYINIPVSKTEISEGEKISNYIPPCPPKGHGTHHYQFTIYALDTSNAVAASNRIDFEIKNKNHILTKATITVTYQR